MKPLFIILLCLSIIDAKTQLLIRNTTLVDVENKKLIAGQDVLVENGIITGIGRKLTMPSSAQIIDGSGKWLMPGLVDAHVHFFQSGGLYARPDAIDLRKYKPYNKEIEWVHNNMEAFLRRYLKAGITSVADVGATISFLQQRDSFRAKWYAPSVYMTGPLLTTWEPEVFKNLGNEEPFFLMKTVDDAKIYVQKQLPYKPDFIKIWYIILGNDKEAAARKHLPMVQAVIEEAHINNLRVAVHATEQITAKLAVEAGADYLVHSVEDEVIDASFVQLLKTKKTVLSPTLIVAGNYHKVFGQEYKPTIEDLSLAHSTPLNSVFDIRAVKDTVLTKSYKAYVASNASNTKKEDSIRMLNLKKLSDAGITIATGTDAGNIGTQHVSSYYAELQAMQQSGMDNWQLLQASTINGAKALGKESEFGSIKKGKRADLLLLNKNPVESISNWKAVEFVINKGISLHPDSIYKPTPVELADQQLVAYNAHNLEAFLAPYADDVEIYELSTNKIIARGKEQMRKQYSFLNTVKSLYCNLLNRMVEDNVVIDHEEIWTDGNQRFYGIAIYETKNGKIQKVWFPR
jgi:imidazolonepropionase-like amidohydrolase